MRISELIEELQAVMDTAGDVEVYSTSDYGDIAHTEQLDPVESIELCNPVESAYSNSGLKFADDGSGVDPDKEIICTLRYTY